MPQKNSLPSNPAQAKKLQVFLPLYKFHCINIIAQIIFASICSRMIGMIRGAPRFMKMPRSGIMINILGMWLGIWTCRTMVIIYIIIYIIYISTHNWNCTFKYGPRHFRCVPLGIELTPGLILWQKSNRRRENQWKIVKPRVDSAKMCVQISFLWMTTAAKRATTSLQEMKVLTSTRKLYFTKEDPQNSTQWPRWPNREQIERIKSQVNIHKTGGQT